MLLCYYVIQSKYHLWQRINYIILFLSNLLLFVQTTVTPFKNYSIQAGNSTQYWSSYELLSDFVSNQSTSLPEPTEIWKEISVPPIQLLNRNRRLTDSHSPPHIIPDLPPLQRFFDRTGLQILCQAAGDPPPVIRWFSLPINGRATSGPSHKQLILSERQLDVNEHRVTSNPNSKPTEKDSITPVEDNYVSELGFSSRVREAPQADQPVSLDKSKLITNGDSKTTVGNNQIVVDGGWLNFTATRSSTMRMVFFCQAENYLGQARSRKMVVHQVPMPDESLKIVYYTFPIKPRQKAVISCQPEQGIFNRFLKVKYWKVYMNDSLLSTVDHSFGRFSMINITKHPELHIRSITEAELDWLEVKCVLQSIVDESVTVERPERGKLQRLQFRFSYTELRSVGNEISVLRGSTVELPWAMEGEVRTGVDWFYVNDGSRVRQAIALDSNSIATASPSSVGSGVGGAVSSQTTTSIQQQPLELPWGTKYELVDGIYGNLRLINLSVSDSGHYIAESTHSARSLRIKYTIRVQAPLGAKITPSRRTVDWGSRVELTCEITGHPRQLIYWLHNSRLVPKRHHVRQLNPTNHLYHDGITDPMSSIAERLIIEAFTLEDIGVYQCIVENGQSIDRLSLSVSSDHLINFHSNLQNHNMSYFNRSQSRHTTESASSTQFVTGAAAAAGGSASSPSSSSLSSPKSSASTVPFWASDQSDSLNHPANSDLVVGSGDLVDNAQATALLMMGKMRPFTTWQYPVPESGSNIAQLLLSVHMGMMEAMLQCKFAANPPPNIIWYRDDQPIPLDESGVLSPQVTQDEDTAYTTITQLGINIRKVPYIEEMWTYGGEYRAVAENTYGQADCRTYVLMETPLRLRPIDITKPAIAGREYTLKCYFIGSGIPTLQWHRIENGREIRRIPVDHRHQLLENGRVLRITEVNQEEDEADYRCTATLGDVTANITVSLKVSHAPRLFDLPQTRQVKDGRDMLSYSCALQNRADKPWYAWWEFQREGTNAIVTLPPYKKSTYDGFSVSYVGDGEVENQATAWRLPDSLRDKVPLFVHTEPNSAVHVTVNELRKEQHHGNLTCVVLNEVGMDKQSIRVTFIPELEFAIRPPNNHDVTLGQTISIDCTAKPSDLQPVVEWKYLQKTTGSYVSVSELSEATNGRIGQLSNGTLLLSNVDEFDPREFLCFLKPGRLSTAAQRSSAVNLEVHVPARIDPIDAVEKVRGSSFNLTCSVYGDPDDLKAAWYYRLSAKSNWQLIDKPCVMPLALVEAGSYNTHSFIGDSTVGSLDTVSSSLSSVTGSTLASVTSASLTTMNDDWISSVADCQSYATEGLESGILFRQVSFFKPNKRGLDKQLQFLNVQEVHMGEYLCRASNKFNRNSKGDHIEIESFVRLTVISVPDPVQFVYNSSRTTATSVSFSWFPPTRDGNKPIRKYRVRYSHSEQQSTVTEESSTTQQPYVTELDVSENQHRLELTNLRPYTKYHITVAAINDVGASVENALALTTQEAKPSGPVRRLIANGTASDTIVVSWDNPLPEHLNGNVDRYSVCRQRVKDSLTLQELTELPWPSDPHEDVSTRGRHGRVRCHEVIRQRDYEINSLPKFTAYAFRVIAMNSKGPSPPAYTQARTLEDLPQAPPADVTCAAQQHSITVSWNPPNPETINGILTEYHVSYFAANVYGDETSSVNQAVKGQTTVTLAGLLAYTNYTIQVAVSNRKGRGPTSPRITCLTKEAPSTAPDRIKAKPINASCIVVSWSHPRKPQGQIKNYCLDAIPLLDTTMVNLITYPVAYNDRAKGPCIRPDLTVPYNYYYYCGLTEERPYNISVRAINQFDGHKAWSGPVSPTSNTPIGIISIGGKITAQNKMPVWMDCLVIGGYEPRWVYPRDDISDPTIMDNGTLVISSAHISHTGQYICSTVSDTITYDLIVQEIVEEPPRKPIWHKFTPSLRGIQAEWLSPGSKRLDAPIQAFYLNWTNLHTGQTEEIRLPSDQRTYYLTNLSCATTVKFQLRAENKMGNSSFTDVTSWTTLGSAPLTANAAQLIPNSLRHKLSVTFNLSSFLPGNGCPPSTYRLLIAPSEDGHFGLKKTLINRTLTKSDLINLDGMNRERCCYNITNLNSGAHYHYKVVATNAAGSASVQGQFWTRTVSGHEPVLRQSHTLGKANLFQQPTVIVPITAVTAVLLVLLVVLLAFCRHRRLEDDLRPDKQITVTHNDLRPTTNLINPTTAVNRNHQLHMHPQHVRQLQQQQVVGYPYHAYHPAAAVGSNPRGRGRDTLPPLPDSQTSTVVAAGRLENNSRNTIRNWFNEARARLYDRGHSSTTIRDDNNNNKFAEQATNNNRRVINTNNVDNTDHDQLDRLSTNSMDSEGNINPYATYAATGFVERQDSNNNNACSTTLTSGPAVGKTIDTSLMSSARVGLGRSNRRDMGSALTTTTTNTSTTAVATSKSGWNAAFRRGLSIPADPASIVPAHPHHYHYPHLDSATGRSHLLYLTRPNGHLRRSQLLLDPRLVPPNTAALIDPMLAPYDNGTLNNEGDTEDGDEDEVIVGEDELTRASVLGPLRSNMRRVNSFESLHQLPRGRAQTYHRGFGVCGPSGRSLVPAGLLNAGPHNSSVSFYESGVVGIQPSDPSIAYRGSVLSSTTVSSNHEELMQAYEYGRKHQLRTCLTLPTNQTSNHLIPTSQLIQSQLGGANANLTSVTAAAAHPELIRAVDLPSGPVEGEVSGAGSVSSDATDSGIRQFTQQPPQPDEPRHAACEVSFICDASQITGGRLVPVNDINYLRRGLQTIGLNRARTGPGNRVQPAGLTSMHCDTECDSTMTDTYATVDYTTTTHNSTTSTSTMTTANTTATITATTTTATTNTAGVGLLMTNNVNNLYDGPMCKRKQLNIGNAVLLNQNQILMYGGVGLRPITSNTNVRPHLTSVPATYASTTYSDADPSSAYGQESATIYGGDSIQSSQQTYYYQPSAAAAAGVPIGHQSTAYSQMRPVPNSSQLRRRGLSSVSNPQSSGTVDTRKQVLNRGPQIQSDKLHTRQLSEPGSDEAVGLLSGNLGATSHSRNPTYGGVRTNTKSTGNSSAAIADDNPGTNAEIEENVYTSEFVLV